MSDYESWSGEMQAVHLYRVMARHEANTPREHLFLSLAKEASSQAAIWARRAEDAGTPVPIDYQPNARVRLVAALVGLLGPRHLRGVLAAMKVRGLSVYSGRAPNIASASETHGSAYLDVLHSAEAEGARHRGVHSGGSLRAAVFGINDGLVSNAGLVMGVAGATSDSNTILLSGIAGLLAGAFSMAAGEYVSMRSQREFFEYQIDLERQELEAYPEEEAEELAVIYEARGIPKEDARRAADLIIADPERALDALAREELGIDPLQLGGAPLTAAAASFVAFATGAFIPVAPFAFHASAALSLAIGCSGLALFVVGATISLFTGRGAVIGGLRMLAIGAAAGGATYSVGSILGVSLG